MIEAPIPTAVALSNAAPWAGETHTCKRLAETLNRGAGHEPGMEAQIESD